MILIEFSSSFCVQAQCHARHSYAALPTNTAVTNILGRNQILEYVNGFDLNFEHSLYHFNAAVTGLLHQYWPKGRMSLQTYGSSVLCSVQII